MKGILFLIDFLISTYSIAYAGRPLSTEDATIAGKGALEAEVGVISGISITF